mmetsp:Transcript_5310/g.21710  ORF Transcript_5310/g.21710 Transcript_5310/m.21710 type:complete len:201 (-) Transcript_5310:41-643(-)
MEISCPCERHPYFRFRVCKTVGAPSCELCTSALIKSFCPYRLRIFISSIAVRRLCSRPGRSTEDRCRLPLRREDISSFQCPLATSVTRPMTTSPVAGAKRIWSGRTRNSLSTCSNIPHMCEVSLPWTNWTPWPRRKLSPEPKPSSVSPGARNDELVSLPEYCFARGVFRIISNVAPSPTTIPHLTDPMLATGTRATLGEG